MKLIRVRENAIMRVRKKPRSTPKDDYQKVFPVKKHKIMEWVLLHDPKMMHITPEDTKYTKQKLSGTGISFISWNRFLKHESHMLVDELYFISKMLGCKPGDLL